MFAGVLDKGEDEVFLGGTRLKRFMESVEKATGSIPASMPQQPDGTPAGQAEGAGSGDAVEGARAERRSRPRRRKRRRRRATRAGTTCWRPACRCWKNSARRFRIAGG